MYSRQYKKKIKTIIINCHLKILRVELKGEFESPQKTRYLTKSMVIHFGVVIQIS